MLLPNQTSVREAARQHRPLTAVSHQQALTRADICLWKHWRRWGKAARMMPEEKDERLVSGPPIGTAGLTSAAMPDGVHSDRNMVYT